MAKINPADYPKHTKVEYGGKMYSVSLYLLTKEKGNSTYYTVQAKVSYQNRRISAAGVDDLAALRALDRKITDIQTGAVGVSGKMTVKRWAKEWAETYKKGNVDLDTYDDYVRRATRIAAEIGDELQLLEVSTVHCQRALNARQGRSGSDIHKEHLVLSSMFEIAFDSGLIHRNPAKGVKKPAGEFGSHRAITELERSHILKVAKTHRAGLWVLLMLHTGLRPGEVIPLVWSDIDFDKRLLYVTKANRGKDNTTKKPKSDAGTRVIPLVDDIYNLLLSKRQAPFDPLFTQQRTGKRHTKTSFYREWESFKRVLDDSMGAKYEKIKGKDGRKRRTKVLSVVSPDLTPHCFRHTCATDMVGKLDIRDTQYLLGHSNISVTAEIYTHITEERLGNIASDLKGKKENEKKA